MPGGIPGGGMPGGIGGPCMGGPGGQPHPPPGGPNWWRLKKSLGRFGGGGIWNIRLCMSASYNKTSRVLRVSYKRGENSVSKCREVKRMFIHITCMRNPLTFNFIESLCEVITPIEVYIL